MSGTSPLQLLLLPDRRTNISIVTSIIQLLLQLLLHSTWQAIGITVDWLTHTPPTTTTTAA